MQFVTNKGVNVVVIMYVVLMGNNVEHHVQYIPKHH
jgi:hypothetical protein